MNPRTDDEWVSVMATYLEATGTGKISRSESGNVVFDDALDPGVYDRLTRWKDINSPEYCGPADMPLRIRQQLELDGILPPGSGFMIREVGGELVVTPALRIAAMQRLAQRLRGRPPTKKDVIEVEAWRVKVSPLNPLITPERITVDFPIGRRLYDLHKYSDVSRDELRTISQLGWTNAVRNRHKAERCSAANRFRPCPVNRDFPASYVPGRPGTLLARRQNAPEDPPMVPSYRRPPEYPGPGRGSSPFPVMFPVDEEQLTAGIAGMRLGDQPPSYSLPRSGPSHQTSHGYRQQPGNQGRGM
ncbi:hypothetical protein [Micromonospora sp. SH-82]|uniref:hypothetical protein n=1 Tax=Micromonospora sp. SH-82 TaxID=3132938 RepID=UPI003EC108A6